MGKAGFLASRCHVAAVIIFVGVPAPLTEDPTTLSHKWTIDAFQKIVDYQIPGNPYLLSGHEEQNAQLAYGELTLEALNDLWVAIADDGGSALQPSDVLVDVGSGRGIPVLWTFLTTMVGRVIGLEVSQTRHDMAASFLRLLGLLASGDIENQTNVEARAIVNSSRHIVLYRTDAFESLSLWARSATVVLLYLRNMGDQTRTSFSQALQSTMPGTIVFAQEKLFGCHRGVTLVRQLRFSPMVFHGGSINMYVTATIGVTLGNEVAWIRDQLAWPQPKDEREVNAPCIDNGDARKGGSADITGDRLQHILETKYNLASNACATGMRRDFMFVTEQIAAYGDSSDMWGCLFQSLSWSPSGGRGFMLPSDEVDALGKAHTYGEITPDGVDQLLEALPRNLSSSDEVVDLGSGTGRFVLQVLLRTKTGIVRGVELSRSRHAHAVRSFSRLLGEQFEADQNSSVVVGTWDEQQVSLENANLYLADLSKSVLIYCNTQAFPDLMVWQLGDKLSAEMQPSGIAAVLGRPLFPCHTLVNIGEVSVPTSWFPATPVFLYASSTEATPAPQCSEFYAKLQDNEADSMSAQQRQSSRTDL